MANAYQNTYSFYTWRMLSETYSFSLHVIEALICSCISNEAQPSVLSSAIGSSSFARRHHTEIACAWTNLHFYLWRIVRGTTEAIHRPGHTTECTPNIVLFSHCKGRKQTHAKILSKGEFSHLSWSIMQTGGVGGTTTSGWAPPVVAVSARTSVVIRLHFMHVRVHWRCINFSYRNSNNLLQWRPDFRWGKPINAHKRPLVKPNFHTILHS